MAEKRMLTKKITDADEFISMPSSAQALYLHLNQGADDDGFNNQVQMAMYKAHASVDDLKVLLAKRYIIQFESGVIVIKHWRMSNALRKDRYTPTAFQEELKMLKIKDNGAYSINEDAWLPNGCQVVATDKNSIGKDSIEKDSIDKYIVEIVDYLNLVCHTNYSYKTKNTIKHINARLNEGFTVDDFKMVIDKKANEWLDTSMEQYLRPDTLFGTKFESYLNQNIVKGNKSTKTEEQAKEDWLKKWENA